MYIGDARIDFEANTIVGRNGQQYVEPKIMRLLKFLADHPNTVHSREDLITNIWGVDFGGDERLSRAISILRKALGEEKGTRKFIETISRGGYRLIAEVSNNAPIDQTKSNTPRKFPFQRITAGLVGALISAVFVLYFINQNPPQRSNSSLPVNERIAEGFDKIRYYGRAGAINNAQSNFTTILQDDPNNAAAHAGLALAYIREYTSLESDPALLKQARASALTALEENEHLAVSHIAMAWVSEFHRETDKALQYLERADILDKDNELTLESRIRLQVSAGNIEEAKDLIQSAVELHPNNPIYHTYAAFIFSSENNFSKAEEYSRRAIELDPENPWNYSSTAQMLHLQNKTNEAIKTIQAGLEVQESASLYNNLGTYLFFQGYYDMAASAFEKTLAFEGNSHDPLSWANLGDAYRWVPNKKNLSEQNYNRALEFWKTDLESKPNSLTLKSRIALYEAKKQTGEKPDALLNEVINSEGLQAIIYYRMLVTAELWGDREKSLNLLKKSILSGYPLNEIRNDPELKALREDKAYHLIVSQ